MSHKTRKNSYTAEKKTNMPQEHVPNQVNPKIVSVIKIEDKLINHQIIAKKKLESLKKTVEEEELKEIRQKPKILEKSRVLAEKAEQKLMQKHSDLKETKNTQNMEKFFTQVQPDLNNRSFSRVNITVERISESENRARSSRKQNKSLLNLSVLERSEEWVRKKEEKIEKIKKFNQNKELAECTFSPTPKSLSRNASRCEKNSKDLHNNLSFISAPLSIDQGYEYEEQNSKIMQKKFVCRQIAPYQVKVSFRCGIDLKSFLKRAK